MAGLSCISLNVRGVGSCNRSKLVASVLSRFDVAFVQESYVNCMGKASAFERKLGGSGYCSFECARSAGVRILMRKNAGLRVLDVLRDTDGRVVSVLVEWSGVRYTFMSVYAPVDRPMRKQFFRDLYAYVFPGSWLVVGGDFNCVLRDCDSSCVTAVNKGGAAELGNFFRDFNIRDIWVRFHRGVPYITWTGKAVGSLLDRLYISEGSGAFLSAVSHAPMGL